jgi:hypothetical protein
LGHIPYSAVQCLGWLGGLDVLIAKPDATRERGAAFTVEASVPHGRWAVAHQLDPTKHREHAAVGTTVKGRPHVFISERCRWAYFANPFSNELVVRTALAQLGTACGLRDLHTKQLDWAHQARRLVLSTRCPARHAPAVSPVPNTDFYQSAGLG